MAHESLIDRLRDQLVNHVACHIGETKIPAVMLEGKAFVVETE